MNLKNRILFQLTEKIILRNKKFKGIHNGESCYLFGNAKSLKYYDLSLFNDRVSIGCNSLFLHKDFSKIGIKYYYRGAPLDYYPFHRNPYTKKIVKHFNGHSLYKKNFHENSDVNFFIDITDYPSLRGENIFYLHNFGQQFSDYSNCNLDGVFSATQSALSGMIGLAIYLGFKDITLVGCDQLLTPKATEHFFEYGRIDQDHSPSVLSEKIVNSAQKFLNLRVVSPNSNYKGHIIEHIQYSDLTGQAEKFKENHEIISDDNLKILRSYNYNYSLTEGEFLKNNKWRLTESENKWSIEEEIL